MTMIHVSSCASTLHFLLIFFFFLWHNSFFLHLSTHASSISEWERIIEMQYMRERTRWKRSAYIFLFYYFFLCVSSAFFSLFLFFYFVFLLKIKKVLKVKKTFTQFYYIRRYQLGILLFFVYF
jgi:hypothetical protein